MSKTALENLRALETQLAELEASAQAEMAMALANAGVPPHPFHPMHDRALERVTEMRIRVAEAQNAFNADDPELKNLRDAAGAALESLENTLAAVVDPAEPRLDTTPEALETFEADKLAHAAALKANAEKRAALEISALERLRGVDSLAKARNTLERAEQDLAAVKDPAEPQLGKVSPENIAALSRALDTFRAECEANERRRKIARSDFAVVMRSVNEAFNKHVRDRNAAGLPSPSLFCVPTGSPFTLNRGALEQQASNLTLPEVRAYRAALGSAPISIEREKQTLRTIAQRKREYEQRKRDAEKDRAAYTASRGRAVGVVK